MIHIVYHSIILSPCVLTIIISYYKYEVKELNLKTNITLKFEKGKKYAIIGSSGSGKTTLIKLIMGYFDNYEGKILFDDEEQKCIRTSELNREISLVQQNVFVFNNTVLYNIIYYT